MSTSCLPLSRSYALALMVAMIIRYIYILCCSINPNPTKDFRLLNTTTFSFLLLFLGTMQSFDFL